MKKNAGFTLIELVVGIAISAIVLSAVSAVVLMGLHNNRLINQAATVQNDSRVITQLLQTLTSRGTIKGVQRNGEDCTIQGEDGDEEKTILRYDHVTDTLKSADGLTFLENVTGFGASVDGDGKVLTLTVEVDGETYERSIFCRTQRFAEFTPGNYNELGTPEEAPVSVIVETEAEEENEEEAGPDYDSTKRNRQEFLKLLATQYGSDGKILYGDGTDTGVTFAEWYSNGAWGEDTPWCACFVSWAAFFANAVGLTNDAPNFAYVPNGQNIFIDKGTWHDRSEEGFTPAPGDYIFFNFNTTDDLPDHVGVVIANTDGQIVTIEGNSSNHVALRMYSLGNTSIMGYGVLDWKTP